MDIYVPHGSPFDLCTKITGPGNSYFNHISTESGCKVFLRGRGSVSSPLVLAFTIKVDRQRSFPSAPTPLSSVSFSAACVLAFIDRFTFAQGTFEPASGNESHEQLHIFLEHSDRWAVNSAKQLCEDLVQTVCERCAWHPWLALVHCHPI